MLALKEEKFILLTFFYFIKEKTANQHFFKSSTIKVREHLGLLWK